MHYNTKFGNKMFGGLEDIWTNMNILGLRSDLNPESSKKKVFFHRTLWLMMMYHPTKFGCQGINSLANIVESVMFCSH